MKTALITGAGGGLGKGFVEYLLDQDFLTFAGLRKPSALNQNKNLKVIELDVTKEETIDKAFEFVQRQVDHLDLLINNVGVNKDTATNNHKEIVCDLPKLDRNTLLLMFDINAISPMIVLQKFLPLMIKNPSFVINISSNRASYHDNTNTSGNYGYRASKAALNMMTLCSLFDLPTNVKTFAVHPGDVKTAMNPEGDESPYNQAEKIIAITKNWNEKCNGKFLNYDGTLYS